MGVVLGAYPNLGHAKNDLSDQHIYPCLVKKYLVADLGPPSKYLLMLDKLTIKKKYEERNVDDPNSKHKFVSEISKHFLAEM